MAELCPRFEAVLQHLCSGGGGWCQHRRQQHKATHLVVEFQRRLEGDRSAHRGASEEERQLRVCLPRRLHEDEGVALKLLGAVDEAALAAAQAVSRKVGCAHDEPAAGQGLRCYTHTGEPCMCTEPMEEEDQALDRAATTLRQPGP